MLTCANTFRSSELSPAVDHERPFTRLVFLHDSPAEGQDGRGIVWHSVVRPGSEVELSHFQRMPCAVC